MKHNVKRINESQLKAIVAESVKKVLNEMQRSDDPEFWERMTSKASDQGLPHPTRGGIYGYFNRDANPNGETPNPKERMGIQAGYRDKFNYNREQAMINALGNCNGIKYRETSTKGIVYYSSNGGEGRVLPNQNGQFVGWYFSFKGHYGPMSITQLVKTAPARDEETANALATWVKKFHPNDSVLADYTNPSAWMGDFSFKWNR